VKKVGHCGTLDPFASGVLPVCVGTATRVVRYMDGYDKEYRCSVRFGAFTDTQDLEGKVIGGHNPSIVELHQMQKDDYSEIRSLLMEMQGDNDQLPPMYSAIKIGGRPLYEYARKGITIERQKRLIHIYSSKVHNITADDSISVDFSLSCSKGTYIRTICNELGEKTGFGAFAQSLQRTRCGPFSIRQAISLEQLEVWVRERKFSDFLLSENLAVAHLPRLEVSEDEAAHIRLGQKLPLDVFSDRLSLLDDVQESSFQQHTDKKLYCAYCNEKLIAVVYPDQSEERDILRIERMLA
jgi:tRNA pseudouridine55 synthase